jgi:hypothetical protein
VAIMAEQREPQWARPSDEDTRAAIATLDSEVLHCGVSRTRTLQRSLRAPAAARTFVAERICPQHGTLATAATALVASEIVTHAALCGEGPITIAVECAVTSLTVSVTCSMDGPSETSQLRLGDPIAGMIVDRVCRASGCLPTEHGVTMWGTIPTGHIPLRNSRAERRAINSPPVSSRPQTSMAIRTLNAPTPQYGT